MSEVPLQTPREKDTDSENDAIMTTTYSEKFGCSLIAEASSLRLVIAERGGS
jgi:hypothetical protein